MTNGVPRPQLDILLVEDNPGDARLIAIMLNEAGGARVRLSRADRIAAGLAALAARSPDAVLLDLSLPDSQGLATFARVREAAPRVPIVVLSGLADETIAVEAVGAGAQDYLVKGRVDGDGLVRALRYAIERQRGEEERGRLLAEAARLAAERAAILGQIADAVIAAGPDGGVAFVNAAARRLLGMADDTLPARWSDRHGEPLAPEDLPLARAARGETIVDGEWRVERPDGGAIIVQGSATPVLAPGGGRLGAVLTLHDITARRALEQEREEFFANASHDLRTPLAAIKASIGVVLANEPPGLPRALHRMLTNIDLAATEMGRLVDDLLELTRLEAGRAPFAPVRLDLRALVGRAARAIEPLAQGRGQTVTVAVPDEPVPAVVDPERLERALLNLLGNAQKYGREGGAIALRVERRPGEAIVAVADDGPGIAAEDQARIFERFYRPATEEARRVVGSGLGLPIVRAIVERHGGRVSVESAPGAGSTFRIALPLAPPAGQGG
jgi:PAS domain S-box-containing protein